MKYAQTLCLTAALANCCARHGGTPKRITIKRDQIVIELPTEEATMPNEKPHKGKLTNWRKSFYGDDSFIILCTFVDHPDFAGLNGHTSKVLKHDEATGEIETRNTRYTLVGPPVVDGDASL